MSLLHYEIDLRNVSSDDHERIYEHLAQRIETRLLPSDKDKVYQFFLDETIDPHSLFDLSTDKKIPLRQIP